MYAELNKLQLISSLSWRLDRVVNLCLKVNLEFRMVTLLRFLVQPQFVRGEPQL